MRVVSFNTHANTPTSSVVADVRRIRSLRGPDVIGFQEVGGITRAQAIRASLVGYRLVRHPFTAAAPVPIAYSARRYRRLRAREWFLSAATFVGRRGAGPATLREKHAMTLLLRDRRTGELHAIGNVHLAPSIRYQQRAELHAEQVGHLAAWVTQTRADCPDAHITITGDFNTSDPDNLKPLADAGLHLHRALRATHNAGRIDWVLSTLPRDRAFTITHLNSDHDALCVDLKENANA